MKLQGTQVNPVLELAQHLGGAIKILRKAECHWLHIGVCHAYPNHKLVIC